MKLRESKHSLNVTFLTLCEVLLGYCSVLKYFSLFIFYDDMFYIMNVSFPLCSFLLLLCNFFMCVPLISPVKPFILVYFKSSCCLSGLV